VKECPSPENPCMCRCHERGAKDGTLKDWCEDCSMGIGVTAATEPDAAEAFRRALGLWAAVLNI